MIASIEVQAPGAPKVKPVSVVANIFNDVRATLPVPYKLVLSESVNAAGYLATKPKSPERRSIADGAQYMLVCLSDPALGAKLLGRTFLLSMKDQLSRKDSQEDTLSRFDGSNGAGGIRKAKFTAAVDAIIEDVRATCIEAHRNAVGEDKDKAIKNARLMVGECRKLLGFADAFEHNMAVILRAIDVVKQGDKWLFLRKDKAAKGTLAVWCVALLTNRSPVSLQTMRGANPAYAAALKVISGK